MYKPKLPDNVNELTWVGPDNKICAESGLIHCIRLPEAASKTQPPPLVVMLHGWGGDESAMWIFKQALPKHVAAVAPRAPLPLNGEGFVWFEETHLSPASGSLEVALEKMEHFMASLPQLYPVDPTQMVLIGFSQGAFMGNAFTLTHPFDVVGVASLAGAMPDMPAVDTHPDLLAGLPIFVAHGLRDNIVPVSAARQTQAAYQKLGADVTYGEYSAAHKMALQAIKDLKTWLAKLFPPQ